MFFVLSGDIILSVNGQSLKGMGHKEAAEVLKDAPNIVTLTVQGIRTYTAQSTHAACMSTPLVTHLHQKQFVLLPLLLSYNQTHCLNCLTSLPPSSGFAFLPHTD